MGQLKESSVRNGLQQLNYELHYPNCGNAGNWPHLEIT